MASRKVIARDEWAFVSKSVTPRVSKARAKIGSAVAHCVPKVRICVSVKPGFILHKVIAAELA